MRFLDPKIIRTTSTHKDFIELVKQLDLDLAKRNGKDHAFYAQFNSIDMLKHAVIAYEKDVPMGCVAMKQWDSETMEIKRMYTSPIARGKGVASLILRELENWATQLNYKKCILETGYKQPEAIALYKKQGYKIIPNYGQYAEDKNSFCFEKGLK